MRSLGYLAISRGDRTQARGYYEQVLAIEPLAEDALRWIVQLIAEKEERPAALKRIADSARFLLPLTRLWYDWLFDDGRWRAASRCSRS